MYTCTWMELAVSGSTAQPRTAIVPVLASLAVQLTESREPTGAALARTAAPNQSL